MTRAFTVVTCEQRTEAWFEARLGRATGSRAKDVIASIKSGEAAARRDYRTELVLERITSRQQESPYINADMQRGIDLEPQARATYEALTGALVEQTGFLSHTLVLAGASLDGHLGDFETLVSLKCPRSANHLRYWRDGGMPREHVPQMLHELWITGAETYHFLSFDDRFPPALQAFFVAVERKAVQAEIDAYGEKLNAFLVEVAREVAEVRALMEKAA